MAVPTSMFPLLFQLPSDDSCSIMVRAQMLAELEEIISYKQYADQPERQQTMRKTWMKRYVIYQAVQTSFTHCFIDYKVVSLMSKFGNAFFKCEHLFLVLKMTLSCGSNLRIYAASLNAWHFHRRPSTPCFHLNGWALSST
jgi:hypothetical protein